MDHDDARALMAAAVEGGLPAPSERELAVHLVGCAECKALYGGLQQAERALRALRFAHPPARAVEDAIRRATTVLRGEADPGPAERAPGVPPPAHLPSSDEVDFDSVQIPLIVADDDEEEVGSPGAEPYVAPALEPDDRPATEEDVPPPPEPEAPAEPEEPAASPEAAPPSLIEAILADKAPPEDEQTDEDLKLPPLPPPPAAHDEPLAASEPIGAEPADIRPYVERATAETPAPPIEERRPAPTRAPRRRAGAARWLGAITATVLVAAAAGYVFTRSQTGGVPVPTAAEVRSKVARAFTQLRTLKASFTIRRLDLYPVSKQGAQVQYSFTVGTTTGRLVYDRTTGYREETTTDVGGNEIATVKVARTEREQRTLTGSGGAAKLTVIKDPPLGPPDGDFRPSLGSLDRAVGEVAAMLTDAQDLEVLGVKKMSDRQVVDVRFDVSPTELSRADRIEVLLDARTSIPVHIRREISSAGGRVLAPESVLQPSALQTAFGNRQRILSEDVDISDLVVDDVILPGDFVLDVPQGVPTQTRSGGFQKVSRADAGSRAHFTPLFPTALPAGFVEQSIAVFGGKPGAWGPANTYPAPDGIVQASYFDGRTTIVITEKHMPKGAFGLRGGPLATGTLPLQTTPETSGEKAFNYSWSPEVPPHAYGFLGDLFVMATGNAPADRLVAVLASLQPASSAPGVPAAAASQQPTANP